MGDFQNVFKKLRLSHGYTQAELADALRISRSTIGMYETGAREPDFETLEIIADFFNVDTDYLIGREDHTTLLLSGIEHELIVRFRELSPAERSLILRSVGINETTY